VAKFSGDFILVAESSSSHEERKCELRITVFSSVHGSGVYRGGSRGTPRSTVARNYPPSLEGGATRRFSDGDLGVFRVVLGYFSLLWCLGFVASLLDFLEDCKKAPSPSFAPVVI